GAHTNKSVHVVSEVDVRIPMLIHRIISTGGTLASALDALIAHGARPEAYVCATHAVLAGPVAKALDRDDVQEFAFTNSIPIPPELRTDRMRILSAAPLLARAIRNIHLNESEIGRAHV